MPKNKNALIRYRTIDALLSDGIGHTVSELCQACEEKLSSDSHDAVSVSRVTLYDDLDTLAKYWNVRIVKTKGRPVKYSYAQGSCTMNGNVLSEQNQSDIASAIRSLESISGVLGIDSTLEKVRSRFEKTEQTMEKLISFQSNPRLHNSGFLWKLYGYIRENQPLIIKYDRRYEEVKEYDFQPWYLKEYSNRWFLMGWKYKSPDSPDGKLINLAIDRIIEPENGKWINRSRRHRPELIRLNTPGEPWSVDFDEYFADIIGVTKYDNVPVQEITLRAEINTREGRYDWMRLVTKPIHHSQKSSEDGHFGYVTLRLRPNPEFYSTLAAYPHVGVISPENVRDSMIETAWTILRSTGFIKADEDDLD